MSDERWQHICVRLQLSNRECEIAYLLLACRSETDIASELAISVHTVHSHFERLYRKLRVRSRYELVLRLFETYVAVAGRMGIPASIRDTQDVRGGATD